MFKMPTKEGLKDAGIFYIFSFTTFGSFLFLTNKFPLPYGSEIFVSLALGLGVACLFPRFRAGIKKALTEKNQDERPEA